MKALIFKEVPKEVLKEEFQKGKPDVIKLYRTDSFGSTSINIMNAKPYSYGSEGGDGNGVVNAIVSKLDFERMYLTPVLGAIDRYIEDEIKHNTISPYSGKTILVGCDVIDNGTAKWEISPRYKIIKTVYLYEINCGIHGEVEVIHLDITEKRKRSINELLK